MDNAFLLSYNMQYFDLYFMTLNRRFALQLTHQAPAVLDGHHFHHGVYTYVKKSSNPNSKNKNTPSRYMGPGGSLNSLHLLAIFCFSHKKYIFHQFLWQSSFFTVITCNEQMSLCRPIFPLSK